MNFFNLTLNDFLRSIWLKIKIKNEEKIGKVLISVTSCFPNTHGVDIGVTL